MAGDSIKGDHDTDLKIRQGRLNFSKRNKLHSFDRIREMTLRDKIYGVFKIDDAVIIELLESPSLLRLKKISQYGVPDKYYHLKNYSRYEHSIGVMLLLRKLGATLEEQAAGLIHDVSHLAFSHIADWVFSDGNKGNEDLQDTLMEEFIRDGKIATILTKHGFSVDRLLNEENYPLLEKKIPDLCADRVDYAMREFIYWLNPGIVKKCLDGLINYNGEIVFNDREEAFIFASAFLGLQTKHWGGFESMVRYHLFSEALKLAVREGVVKKKDFYKDEPFILAKLENQKSPEIEDILNLLKKRNLKEYEISSSKKVFKKFRYVDPKVVVDGKLVKLSSLSQKFTKLLDKNRKISEKGLVV